MNPSRGLFIEKAILFLAVLVPLAHAEGSWQYLGAGVLAVAIGWWTLAYRRRPLLGPATSRVFVLVAFGLLLFEYAWSMKNLPVIALSHFMSLVCASKFLQKGGLRDDAQFAVLCLLLLVVAAIVSGNVVFLAVLLIYLTIGLDLLIRFNLFLEQARADRASAGIGPSGAAAPEEGLPPAGGVLLVVVPFALVVGVAVFTFCPRIGAGMFGRAEARGGGATVTGISSSIDFNHVGPVVESEKPIMRVQVDEDGELLGSAGLYLRGGVFDCYASSGFGRGWEWQRFERIRPRSFSREETGDGEFNVLPDYTPAAGERVLTQRYTIEQGAIRDAVLFCLYPPLSISGISSDEVERIGKFVDDQSLRTSSRFSKTLRYTITSPAAMTSSVVRALQAERERELQPAPEAHPPDPPLPRQNEIRDLVLPLQRAAGPLDVPENRARFAASLVDWLRSMPFVYTLDPPAPRPGVEPIGDFLLRHKSGYCQHFASAMVIMCQLADVPARLVSGFRCDSFNEMGRFWSVRGKHAHAWVEVYIPGRDWVRFDPTPSGGNRQASGIFWLSRLRSYGEYLQFQWGSFVLAYDAQRRRELLAGFREWLMRPARNQSTILGKVTAFVYELFAWRLEMSWKDRLLYWIFALLIVALVVGIGYIVVVVSWRAARWLAQLVLSMRTESRRLGDAVFYHRLCRRLAALGLRRRPDQTPAEFAADVAARHPALRPATEVVSAYYGVIYGNHGLSPDRRQAFEEFLRKLNGLDRASLESS